VVFAALLTFAVLFKAPLDAVADPTDATYVPRPEWYFMSLFQLLKYFPGPLEPVATVVIPGVTVGLLLALPFLDRRPDRHPAKRPLVLAAFAIGGAGIATLTYLGISTTPVSNEHTWGPLPVAGREFVQDTTCVRCHVEGGAANPIAGTRLRKDPEWLLSHVRDPEIIAPGLREVPPGGMSPHQARSILSYMRKASTGSAPPELAPDKHQVAVLYGRYCANCHMIDGEGGSAGPDLTREGQTREAQWLKDWIYEPEAVDPGASMPAFGERLSEEELNLIVSDLVSRK
jgi:ubiquinol-cytochrome c reductase cytochrome b subunit